MRNDPARRPRLDELVAGSAGSRLIGYTFESKSLAFQLFHEGLGDLLSFHVATDTVHGRTVRADPGRSTCVIELIDLETRLFRRDGRYLAPTEPDQFLDDARGRLTLAYGRRCSEIRWLVRLQADYPLLVFLVRDLADIRWTLE